MTEQTVATIEKNKGEVVHITLKEYQGHDLLDVRVFYKPAEGGEPRPTAKGVCMKVERLPELISALQEAERTARDVGTLAPEGEGEAA